MPLKQPMCLPTEIAGTVRSSCATHSLDIAYGPRIWLAQPVATRYGVSRRGAFCCLQERIQDQPARTV